jgi:serine protease AprX
MNRYVCRVLMLGIAIVAGISAIAAGKPGLVLETSGGARGIWVKLPRPDGSVERHLLRTTNATVTLGAAGLDPSERAAFANWTEDGVRFTSWSRDAGRSWSEPQQTGTALQLLAGRVEPGAALPAPPEELGLPGTGQLFIVQFRSISLPEFREAIKSFGAEVLQPFPWNGHIVRMSPDLVPSIRALGIVERVEPYRPYDRLEPELRAWLAESGGDDPVVRRVRVMAFAWGPAGKDRIRIAAEALGATTALAVPSGQIIELLVTRAQLRALSGHDDVMWVDRWSAPENDMDLVREDDGANWLESGTSNCGQGVRGEVMDGGIQQNHQDFDGIVMHTAADVVAHGTSTFGIVFGNGARDGDGNAQATSNLPCKEAGIFADYDAVADRFAHTQQLKQAPYFASFQSNSWGDAPTTAYTSVSSQMDDIIWRLDIAITQSQSNNGNTLSRPQAWAKNIISVGGIYHFNTLSTSDDAWNSGASTGPAADGRIKPDVSYWYDSIFTTNTGNGYTSSFGGTSAATPEVAGVLGLMVKMWSDNVWNTNPTGSTVFARQPHFSTMKALLVNNAQQYAFSGTTADLTRTHQGWGRPSARVAKERAVRSLIVDQGTPLVVGQTVGYNVTVLAGEPELKVTMVYPDPPGTTSATLHRINDLDLKVTSPAGTIYWGNNGLNAGKYSTSGGTSNTVDTVENVFVQNPAAGNWHVDVRAAQINQDAYTTTPAADAVFSLVVTGARPVCGNGVKEGSEECDGSDLGGTTCSGVGCGGGTLSCNASCQFVYTSCTSCPACPATNSEGCGGMFCAPGPATYIDTGNLVCSQGATNFGCHNGQHVNLSNRDCRLLKPQGFCDGTGLATLVCR